MRGSLRFVGCVGAVWSGLALLVPAPAAGQRGSATPPVNPAPLLTAAQLRTLDEYIETVRQQWEIPGLAIAIVQGDSVVFAKGYGVKELGKADRVDERTLFSIGSSGKSMT
ncbi:MAG: serine hydrolase, partial [Gemmatimonadetes bacterium]|nr:serine hydrolase [Gemmatimonadota bacterium]